MNEEQINRLRSAADDFGAKLRASNRAPYSMSEIYAAAVIHHQLTAIEVCAFADQPYHVHLAEMLRIAAVLEAIPEAADLIVAIRGFVAEKYVEILGEDRWQNWRSIITNLGNCLLEFSRLEGKNEDGYEVYETKVAESQHYMISMSAIFYAVGYYVCHLMSGEKAYLDIAANIISACIMVLYELGKDELAEKLAATCKEVQQ